MICSRCNNDIPSTSKYCSYCGMSMKETETEANKTVAAPAPIGTFSAKEIELLLEINRKTVRGRTNQSLVSQDDIDKLFE